MQNLSFSSGIAQSNGDAAAERCTHCYSLPSLCPRHHEATVTSSGTHTSPALPAEGAQHSTAPLATKPGCPAAPTAVMHHPRRLKKVSPGAAVLRDSRWRPQTSGAHPQVKPGYLSTRISAGFGGGTLTAPPTSTLCAHSAGLLSVQRTVRSIS